MAARDAAVRAPVLAADGPTGREADLDPAVFAAEVRPHLVHEAVRAELNAHRAGTRGAKSRGLVAGGRAKPWRQKGTGRARAGSIRAPQFTGGGVAFPPGPRSFTLKVNRKARQSAMRSALSDHAGRGTLAVLADDAVAEPSTRTANGILAAWQKELPLLVVAATDEETVAKSFRNLERVVVTAPSELEVSALVWARSVLVSEAALPDVHARAGRSAVEATS